MDFDSDYFTIDYYKRFFDLDYYKDLSFVGKLKLCSFILIILTIMVSLFYKSKPILIIIYLIILLYVVYLLIFKSNIIKNDGNENMDRYDIDIYNSNVYHYHFEIDYNYLKDNTHFEIFKTCENNKEIDNSDYTCGNTNTNDYDFLITLNNSPESDTTDEYVNNELMFDIKTLNNVNDNVYEYNNQEQNINFKHNTGVYLDDDILLDLILYDNYIYIIINKKLVKSKKMDFEFSDYYDIIYTNKDLLKDINISNKINYQKFNYLSNYINLSKISIF